MNPRVTGKEYATAAPIAVPFDEEPLYVPHKKVYPQRVVGRFRTIKWAVLIATLGIYYLLPFDKAMRKTAKHAAWLVIAWWTGGAWVLYFADAPTLVRELATFQAPAAAWIAIALLTFTTYSLAGHMREQVCR